ncbi:MAG: hypothetical protein RIS35_1804 [Pseudomonadota bacterium]|jgi:ATP synthase protein I
MFAAVGLQVVSVLVFSLLAVPIGGWTSAKSLLLGGLAVTIPSALFALRLSMHKGRPPESYPVVFFVGEFVKIGLTVALLAAILRWQPDVRWLPAIIGVIVGLKAPLLLPFVVRDGRSH